MSNPLQPRVIRCLEDEYKAYVINITAASKSGNMDVVACIKGQFYGFEIKWKSDQPSALQRQKINACIDAGGKAYFIRSLEALRRILDQDVPPDRYDVSTEKFRM